MAFPKVLGEIKAQLDRIEAKLDAALKPPAPASSALTDTERAASLAAQLAYDSYTVKEIAERVDSLTPDERVLLADYEATHKNRAGALAALRGERE